MIIIPLYWYPVIWVAVFALGFGTLMIMGRDPYFNPHIGWCTLVGMAGAFEWVSVVFISVSTYNWMVPQFAVSMAAVSAIVAGAVTVLVWTWAIIQTFF